MDGRSDLKMPIISLQSISKAFGKITIIRNLSCDFSAGEFYCLLGASGSGKTTLLRLIAGLEKADSGIVSIDGNVASQDRHILLPSFKRNIGFVFQDLALWPHLTVYENVAFGLRLQRSGQLNENIARVLTHFNLQMQAAKYPHQLSGGQQQLAAIARSLAVDPKILLLDEPLANLDVKLKAKIRSRIQRLTSEFNVTIIYVTHDHREAFHLADEIVLMNDGRIEASGSPAEIRQSGNEFVKEFIEL